MNNKAMNMNPRESKELAISEIILIILAVVSLAVVLWIAWFKPLHKGTRVSSYAECVAAGNQVQGISPPVCVTPEGKRFVSPTGKAKSSADHTSLMITEWNVRLLLGTLTQDMYYTYQADGTVQVSTRALDAAAGKVEGCKSGLHGLTFSRVRAGDKKDDGTSWTKQELMTHGMSVNGYYYIEKSTIEPQCVVQGSEKNVAAIHTIQAAIRDAFSSVRSP